MHWALVGAVFIAVTLIGHPSSWGEAHGTLRQEFRAAVALARRDGVAPGSDVQVVMRRLKVYSKFKDRGGILKLEGMLDALPRGCYPLAKRPNWSSGKPLYMLGRPFPGELYPAEPGNDQQINATWAHLPDLPISRSTDYWVVQGRVLIIPAVIGVWHTQNAIVLLVFRLDKGRFHWKSASARIDDYAGMPRVRTAAARPIGGTRWTLEAKINSRPEDADLGDKGTISAVWDGKQVVDLRSIPARPRPSPTLPATDP